MTNVKIVSTQPGQRLREEVERLGVSALSRRLGVARNTLYNWAEKQNIPLEQLFELAEAGADLSYILTGQRWNLQRALSRIKNATELAALIGGAPEDVAKNQARIFELLRADDARAEDEEMLIADYRRCDPPDQEVIRKMARTLAKPNPEESKPPPEEEHT